MKTQQLLFALTIANAALFTFSVTRPYRTEVQEVALVIRGRAESVRVACSVE